jgi:DNA oxidative demethylase
MPACFLDLADRAAVAAGFNDFVPDACLINRYEPGTRLTLHQDRNERDFKAPIVSVSLGLPATFLFGGEARTDRTRRVRLFHGDVVVWGGPSRLAFQGRRASGPGPAPNQPHAPEGEMTTAESLVSRATNGVRRTRSLIAPAGCAKSSKRVPG